MKQWKDGKEKRNDVVVSWSKRVNMNVEPSSLLRGGVLLRVRHIDIMHVVFPFVPNLTEQCIVHLSRRLLLVFSFITCKAICGSVLGRDRQDD